MNLTKRSLLVASGALLAGCATATLAPAGAYRSDNGFSVTLQRPWSDLSGMMRRAPGVRTLSMDGPFLNLLYLAGIAPGGSLVRPVDRDTPRPTYRTDMSDTELVEFVVDCLAIEYQAPQSSGLRPQTLAGSPGVRFDVAMRTKGGLNISGAGLVARAGDKLNLMLFIAPSEHYFGAFSAEVEAIFASAAAA